MAPAVRNNWDRALLLELPSRPSLRGANDCRVGRRLGEEEDLRAVGLLASLFDSCYPESLKPPHLCGYLSRMQGGEIRCGDITTLFYFIFQVLPRLSRLRGKCRQTFCRFGFIEGQIRLGTRGSPTRRTEGAADLASFGRRQFSETAILDLCHIHAVLAGL